MQVVALDVLDPANIEHVAALLKDQPIDVLLNVAGVFDSVSNTVDDDTLLTSMSDMTRVFQTNTIAPRIIAEWLLPNLHLGTERLVVTISSVMGTFATLDDYHACHWLYGASKAAVTYAMTAFAKTSPDVKSVLIHPGWVKTHMGGKDAPLDPAEVAEKIYLLIENHKDRLPNGVFVDVDGSVMER